MCQEATSDMSDLQFAKNTASCAFVKRRIGLEYNFTATSKIDKTFGNAFSSWFKGVMI